MAASRTIARVYEPFVGGKMHDQVLIAMWFFIIGMPMPWLSPFRYLFTLYFLALFAFDTRNLVNGMARTWWLFPYQAIIFFSSFWSPYGSQAFRTSIVMMLSMVIVVIIAARLTPQQILRCMMLSCAAVAFYIIAQRVPVDHVPAFGSKNFAAIFVLTGFILSMSVALNPKEYVWIRWFGVLMTPISAYLVIGAKSTTALLIMIISAVALISMRLFFVDAQKIRNLSSLIFVLGLTLAIIIVYGVLLFVDARLIDSFLALFGKDTTFTGRTSLWSEAFNQISMRPYLGVGLEGFWQYDVGAAQTLNEYDHKPVGTKLSFHNAHLEVLVHFGFVGYATFALSLLAVLWLMTKNLFSRSDLPAITFIVVAAVALIYSMFESALWSSLHFLSFLFFAGGAVYARGDRRKFVGNLVVREEDPEPDTVRAISPA